ncbi:SIS domain-containing protein [Nocardia arthritidis]|uniref:SIS domain-containing protein n=1 Tax=Nocardia arthritidis TaxID=228602 RepID=A0A6G9YH94_9NOCA|nr:SIS domain-containing protein [Nocardia arthritidis]
MAAEISEQPAAWQRLLSEGTDAIRQAAARIAEYQPRFVLFVARGTSDHAALYGKYLVEIQHALPAGLVSPSTMTIYGSAPDLRDVLFIAVSQSGGSPDLVQSVEVARRQGALTVALTNNPASPLAAAAEIHVDILAGPERAVAATKSYTAQLLALYLLLDYARGGDGADTDRLPALGTRVLESGAGLAAAAERYRFAQRLITSARGYSYPTAREAALKLMETSYLSAQAFSGADLLHGPLATVDPRFRCWRSCRKARAARRCGRCSPGSRNCAPMCSASARPMRCPTWRAGSCCRPVCPNRFRRCWKSFRCNSSRCTWRSPAAAIRTGRAG